MLYIVVTQARVIYLICMYKPEGLVEQVHTYQANHKYLCMYVTLPVLYIKICPKLNVSISASLYNNSMK